jgi:DnaJ-class molecular chaperone
VNQGFFSMEQPCPDCRGSGRIVETPCPTCHGSGAERRTRKLPGQDPGGRPGRRPDQAGGSRRPGPAGGQPGTCSCGAGAPHAVFGRKGDDLTLDLPVTYRRPRWAPNVEVPTLNGPVTMKVPAGTRTARRSGSAARAPRRARPRRLCGHRRASRCPQALSRRRKLLKQLREDQKESPRAPGRGRMRRRSSERQTRRNRRGAGRSDERAVYIISVAAELVGGAPADAAGCTSAGGCSRPSGARATRAVTPTRTSRVSSDPGAHAARGVSLAGVKLFMQMR